MRCELLRVYVYYSGLDVLKELCESTSRRSQFTQLALDCLLDNCISAKYWLTGQLSPTDIIQDGFYDVGLVGNEVL